MRSLRSRAKKIVILFDRQRSILRVAFLPAIFFPFEGSTFKATKNAHKAVCIVGDSILRTGVRPRKKFADSCIYSRGVKGDTRGSSLRGINSSSKNWYNLARRDHHHQTLSSLTTPFPVVSFAVALFEVGHHLGLFAPGHCICARACPKY